MKSVNDGNKGVRALAAELGIPPSVVSKKRAKGKSDVQIALEAQAHRQEQQRKQAEINSGVRGITRSCETEAEADRRLAISKANQAEMEEQRKRGELVLAESTTSAWHAMISAAKAKILNVPDEIGDKLASESNPIRCRELVAAKLKQAMYELSEVGQ